jgi:hypothetical protein
MENWKRAVVAGSLGASALFFLKGQKVGGVLTAGVGLAMLAAEYPERFEKIREEIPYYVDRGTKFLEVVTRVGERFAEMAETRGKSMWEELLSY